MNVFVGFFFSYEVNVVVVLFLVDFLLFFSKQLNSEYYGVLNYINLIIF